MATGVGLAQITLAQLNSPTPITPGQVVRDTGLTAADGLSLTTGQRGGRYDP